MTLQKRVLLLMLVVTPLVWLLTLTGTYLLASHEIDEFFDTQQVRLAQQALRNVATLSPATAQSTQRAAAATATATAPSPSLASADRTQRNASPEELVVSAWTAEGVPLQTSDGAIDLPFRAAANGFETLQAGAVEWHVYYMSNEARTVAVGQLSLERKEVLSGMLVATMAPMVLLLPLLILGTAFAVSRAFRPLRVMTHDLSARTADDLEPIDQSHAPQDLKPLIESMNGLFDRIRSVIAHERRLTADASHELRSPIAGLRVQWDAMMMARDDEARQRAMRQIDSGIARLSRLVGQLLNLATLESDHAPRNFGTVSWSMVIENAISDVLPLMNERSADIAVDWPTDPAAALPIRGDNALLSMMIRNLLDNSLRYGLPGIRIIINMEIDRFQVIDDGPGMPQEVIDRLGERFVRPPGQQQSGSGIGMSIVQRVARLHGLLVEVTVPSRQDSRRDPGTIVTLQNPVPDRAAPGSSSEHAQTRSQSEQKQSELAGLVGPHPHDATVSGDQA